MSLPQKGQYYMHENAMDVCVKVLSAEPGSNKCTVEWWNLGYTGNPWPLEGEGPPQINITSAWRNITELVNKPRPWR